MCRLACFSAEADEDEPDTDKAGSDILGCNMPPVSWSSLTPPPPREPVADGAGCVASCKLHLSWEKFSSSPLQAFFSIKAEIIF